MKARSPSVVLGSVLDPQSTCVVLDDAVGDREAEARAPFTQTSRVERFENSHLILDSDSGPVVLNDDFHGFRRVGRNHRADADLGV